MVVSVGNNEEEGLRWGFFCCFFRGFSGVFLFFVFFGGFLRFSCVFLGVSLGWPVLARCVFFFFFAVGVVW